MPITIITQKFYQKKSKKKKIQNLRINQLILLYMTKTKIFKKNSKKIQYTNVNINTKILQKKSKKKNFFKHPISNCITQNLLKKADKKMPIKNFF